jgi:ABC-2 type transport system permease protein
MSYGKTFLQLAKMSVYQSFEHRANVLSQVFLQLVNYGFLVLFIEIIFSRVNSVAGWSSDEMQLLGVLAQTSSILYSTLFAGGVSRFQESVRTGGFDFYLLKPLDAQIHCVFSRMNPSGLLALAGPAIWIVYLVLERKLHISLTMVPVALFLLMAGVSIRYAFGLSTAVLSFLLTKVSALQSLQASLLNQSHYPISIYSEWMRTFAVYMVPVALLANTPAAVLLNEKVGVSALILVGYATFAIICTRIIYHKLVVKYTSVSS